MNSAFVTCEELSRYWGVLSTEAEELLIKASELCLNFLMGKAFVKINVTIRLFLVS